MRLLFIRHGDPDYTIDSLTGQGWLEAELLSDRISGMDIDEFFVSPLGRAKDTASLSLRKAGRTAKELGWLREFSPKVHKPYEARTDSVAWDWIPGEWTKRENFFEKDAWYEAPEFEQAGVKEEYDSVTSQMDAFLAERGYVREGYVYRAERPNRTTVAFFCHFGIICVLLSHLMNVSPMILWHHTALAPTSVSVLYTEERREGIAQFRANALGDISHLYAKGVGPSFSARFCETFDSDERHD